VLGRLSPILWTGIRTSTSDQRTAYPSLREDDSLEEDRRRRRRWLRRLLHDRRSRPGSPLVLPSGAASSPPPPPVTTRLPDGPIPALGEASMPGAGLGVRVLTAPAMSARSSSWRGSRKESTAGEEETPGGTPLASHRPGIAGVGAHSCLPLDVPVPATAGVGISVLTVVVARNETSCPATSAGVGGGRTRPKEKAVSAPAGGGGVSIDTSRGDVSPGKDFGVGTAVSGAQKPGEPGDTYDQERRGWQRGIRWESRHESGDCNPVRERPRTRELTRSTERSPVTRVPAPDFGQKIPCCSTNLSHNTPCHPSAQKDIETPSRLREPARIPLLYSLPVTRSSRKPPEGAEGGTR